MRRKRALEDKQTQTVFRAAKLTTEEAKDEELRHTVQSRTSTLATYSIYFYNVLKVCSCDVLKFYIYVIIRRAVAERETQSCLFVFFVVCLFVFPSSGTRLQMIDSVHSLVFSFGPSEDPVAVRCHSCVNQGEWHVPASESPSFLCGVCDFTELAYFTRCLQRTYVVDGGGREGGGTSKQK